MRPIAARDSDRGTEPGSERSPTRRRITSSADSTADGLDGGDIHSEVQRPAKGRRRSATSLDSGRIQRPARQRTKQPSPRPVRRREPRARQRSSSQPLTSSGSTERATSRRGTTDQQGIFATGITTNADGTTVFARCEAATPGTTLTRGRNARRARARRNERQRQDGRERKRQARGRGQGQMQARWRATKSGPEPELAVLIEMREDKLVEPSAILGAAAGSIGLELLQTILHEEDEVCGHARVREGLSSTQ